MGTRLPHSLGLLYSAFTYYTGFKVNSGEYKLMGLAPCGEPRDVDRILGRLVDLEEDGTFRLDIRWLPGDPSSPLSSTPCSESEAR